MFVLCDVAGLMPRVLMDRRLLHAWLLCGKERRFRRGGDAKLLQRVEPIPTGPGFDDFAAGGADDAEAGHGGALARWWHALQDSLIRALGNPAAGYRVSFRHQAFDVKNHVGKRRAIGGDEPLLPFNPITAWIVHIVADHVGVYQLVKQREVALGPALLKVAVNERLR